MRSRASEEDRAAGARGAAPPAGIDAGLWRAQTPFRRAVYRALLRVPAGQVTTYAALAQAVGCGSPRAVGQALRHNPFAPAIPCHRVVAADGSLTGYAGQSKGAGLARKRALLEAEGVRFSPVGKVAVGTALAILR